MTAPTEPGVIDLTGIPLRDLWILDGDVLDEALRRLAEQGEGKDKPQRSVSAFNSAV
jgi:hypothetical protein